jgi:hypothetical protein
MRNFGLQYYCHKRKVKRLFNTGLYRPLGLQEVEAAEFLDSWRMKVALATFTFQEICLVLIYFGG